ncbi:hypothetical protein HBI85_147370 [Parastagonospora nodorum]|nr:hypothetical protein HBI85_147370 [Parastagonospora nodorum]
MPPPPPPPPPLFPPPPPPPPPPPFFHNSSQLGDVLLTPFAAHPLVRPHLRLGRRAAKHARHVALHRGHEHVQREHIPAGVGSAAVQVSGAGDATWWVVLDWGVGGAGGEGQAGYGVGEVQIEKV